MAFKFDFHQPTAIRAMVDFEDSWIGGDVLTEDVGLEKTIEVIGLLLFRSNERRRLIKENQPVPEAKPTLTLVPCTLVSQWVREIIRFTSRFRSRLLGNFKECKAGKTSLTTLAELLETQSHLMDVKTVSSTRRHSATIDFSYCERIILRKACPRSPRYQQNTKPLHTPLRLKSHPEGTHNTQARPYPILSPPSPEGLSVSATTPSSHSRDQAIPTRNLSVSAVERMNTDVRH
jgi:hypothetical protein